MNYLQVNVLKKTEQRHQGVVGRRFILILLLVVPALLMALVGGIKFIQYKGVQSELQASREIWRHLDVRFEQFKAQKRALTINRQALSLIEGWENSKVSLEKLLLEIQHTVPSHVQLSRVSIRSEGKRTVYKEGDDLNLGFHLDLHGIAQGDEAEELVIKLGKELFSQEYISEIFDSVKLLSMRKRMGRNNVNMREFSFEGRAIRRDAQD